MRTPSNAPLCWRGAQEWKPKSLSQIKVADLGIASEFGCGVLARKQMVGTPGYIAPEMAKLAPAVGLFGAASEQEQGGQGGQGGGLGGARGGATHDSIALAPRPTRRRLAAPTRTREDTGSVYLSEKPCRMRRGDKESCGAPRGS